MTGTRIGTVIRAERQARGMTLRSLARQAGVSFSFLSQFECGTRTPRPEMVLKIANVFPAVDSTAWLFLLLIDTWGPAIAEVMRAWAVAIGIEIGPQPSLALILSGSGQNLTTGTTAAPESAPVATQAMAGEGRG